MVVTLQLEPEVDSASLLNLKSLQIKMVLPIEIPIENMCKVKLS